MTTYIEWGNGTNYTEDQGVFVNDPDNPDLFISLASHTSSLQNKPLEGKNWQSLWKEVGNKTIGTAGTAGTAGAVNTKKSGFLDKIRGLFDTNAKDTANGKEPYVFWITNGVILIVFLIIVFFFIYTSFNRSNSSNIMEVLRKKQDSGEISGFKAINNAFRDLINLTNPGRNAKGSGAGPDIKQINSLIHRAASKALEKYIEILQRQNIKDIKRINLYGIKSNILDELISKLEGHTRTRGTHDYTNRFSNIL